MVNNMDTRFFEQGGDYKSFDIQDITHIVQETIDEVKGSGHYFVCIRSHDNGVYKTQHALPVLEKWTVIGRSKKRYDNNVGLLIISICRFVLHYVNMSDVYIVNCIIFLKSIFFQQGMILSKLWQIKEENTYKSYMQWLQKEMAEDVLDLCKGFLSKERYRPAPPHIRDISQEPDFHLKGYKLNRMMGYLTDQRMDNSDSEFVLEIRKGPETNKYNYIW